MSNLQSLLQTAIHRWRSEDIPIRPGVDPTKIIEFESHHGVVLPSDMREYFLTVDGMGDHYDDGHFFRFWPLEHIRSTNECSSDLVKIDPESGEYYYFFDHSMEVFLYAIRLSNSKSSPAPVAYVSSPYNPTFQLFCESFSEFLAMYVTDPGHLLSGVP